MRGRLFWALLFVVPAIVGGLVMAAVLLIPLPEPDNPEVTEVLDAGGATVARMYTEDRIEILVSQMPKHLLNAVVAVEDDRFYKHHGIDPVGIMRAVVHNVKARKVVEGGSTLTMQLARNLSFSGTRLGQEVTVMRKLKEALITLKLEYKYSKEQILGLYWNTIYLGRGAYGVERAAQTYFGKSAQQLPENQPLNLSLNEAAILAAIPQAPEWYSLEKPEAQADLRERRDLVLTKMAEQGYVTAAEAEMAKQEPITFKRPSAATESHPDFVDYVTRELRERYPHVAANLHQGGYRIYTTMDSAMQRAARKAVAEYVPKLKQVGKEQPQVALVALESETGYLRALVGGREEELDINRALEPRQPGSTFKPFVYAAVLSTKRFTASSTQVDEPREFPGKAKGETWKIDNWEGKSSKKPETMRTALKLSLNTVTAAWMDELKPRPVINLARDVGLEADYPDNLTIGLGTVAVTPLQMTTAFAALANGGYRITPMAVLRVEDRQGNVLVAQQPNREPALDPGVAFIVTDMLKEVLRPGGTGDKAGAMLGGRPVAGKSGTTDNSVDAWFMGYTPQLVTGIWTGYDDRRPTNLLGGNDVSPIWGRFMSEVLPAGDRKDWSPPAGLQTVEICKLTGLLPNASCPVAKEWYLEGTVPTQIDPTVHWHGVVPQLPGVPWAPPGVLPPAQPEKPSDQAPEQTPEPKPEPKPESTPEPTPEPSPEPPPHPPTKPEPEPTKPEDLFQLDI